MRWGVEKRLEFIETRLFWEGRINRKDLTEFFGISVPQASSDLQLYQKKAPKNIGYDKKKKFYYAKKNFVPKFIKTNAEYFFTQLKVSECKKNNDGFSFFSGFPECYVVPTPERNLNIDILRDIIQSVRWKMDIEVEYQSMSRPESSTRWLSPHAFGYDGLRWHIRAFCHGREEYRDFVIGRILSVKRSREGTKDLTTDKYWHTTVILKFKPHPELNSNQKRIIEKDYLMQDGFAEIKVKKGFLFYLKKKLGFDKDHKDKPAHQQQIILIDEYEVDEANDCFIS